MRKEYLYDAIQKQLTLLAVCLVSFCLPSLTAADKIKPNSISILLDDQGYYDLVSYGGTEFDTPRIGRMARRGIRFTDYYAARRRYQVSSIILLIGQFNKQR